MSAAICERSPIRLALGTSRTNANRPKGGRRNSCASRSIRVSHGLGAGNEALKLAVGLRGGEATTMSRPFSNLRGLHLRPFQDLGEDRVELRQEDAPARLFLRRHIPLFLLVVDSPVPRV